MDIQTKVIAELNLPNIEIRIEQLPDESLTLWVRTKTFCLPEGKYEWIGNYHKINREQIQKFSDSIIENYLYPI